MLLSMKQVKKTFPGVSPLAWEHPADTAALAALKQIPLLDELLAGVLGLTSEKSLRLVSLATSVRVTERQFPRVHRLLLDACAILDAPEVPELYVAQSPLLNAGALGVRRPFISLNSATVAQLADEELLGVIAHELGHVLSGHVLYKTLLVLLVKLAAGALPIGRLALEGAVAALKEWDRRSELSADRAGLLATQDREVSFSLLMKTAGGSSPAEMSLEEFLAQAKEYESGGDVLDSVHKLLNLLDESHPFAVLRLADLKSWTDSGAYGRILEGDYPRRGGRPEDAGAAFGRAADSYRDEARRSGDPLVGKLRDVGSAVEEAGKQAAELLKGLFGQGQEPAEKKAPEDRTPRGA